jgi:hypothetical protein
MVVAALAWSAAACDGELSARADGGGEGRGRGGGDASIAQDGSAAQDASRGGGPRYELGPVPEAVAIRWPEAPQTTREVTVSDADAFDAAGAQAGTRIRVSGNLDRRVFIGASDIDVVVDAGVRIASLFIGNRNQRIRIEGGHYDAIQLQVPGTYHPTEEWHDEWFIEDVLIDGVTVDASDTAFEVRGKRVAIVRSQVTAVRYSVWVGDTDRFRSEDVILAGNHFASAGPEPTVRLVNVLRSVTVENRIENTIKHNYRTHGSSDLNYAARNLLVGTGVMLGTMPQDAVDRQWFDDNTLHHDAPSLLLVDPAIPTVRVRHNTAYSDVVGCLVCQNQSDRWTVEGNEVRPYEPPPAP